MIEKFHESKNLAAGTLNISKLVNSVTINSDSNGYFTVQGTSDSAGGRTSKISDNITLQSGIYRLTIGGSISCTLCVSNAADNAFITGFTNNGTFAINTETTIYFGLNFVNDNVYNDNFYIMLQPYTTDYPYEPYGDTWNTKSYAKIVDTTQQVTSYPVVVRPMENAIPSWTIKGNMVQDGTPSPSNVIYPSECGERTVNLIPFMNQSFSIGNDLTVTCQNGNLYFDGDCTNKEIYSTNSLWKNNFAFTLDAGDYTSKSSGVGNLGFYLINYDTDVRYSTNFTLTETTKVYFGVYIYNKVFSNQQMIAQVNSGNTSLPYEPYGYKLDIKSANTTTPVYLGEVQSTRRIKKLVLTGEETWYSRSGSPANIFFIEFQNRNTVDNMAICSHYINQDTGIPDDLQDKHILVRLSSTDNKFFILIRDSSYSTSWDFKTYLAQQYANGTPVTVWYVQSTPTTGIVNEPIRKISSYVDTVSGTNLSVTAQSPTAIDVDTSLKPSEMNLTYIGTKMCGRKKYVHGNSPQVMPSAAAETKELNGITVTCDGKGTYTISGTASEYASIVFNIPEFTTPISIGQGGNGTLSFFNTFDTNKTQIAFYYNSTRVDDWVCTPLNRTNTVYSAIGNKTINKITFNVSGGTSVQGTVSPMFTNDGQLPSTYQSYLQWQ